jgi:hypothetical protein
MSGESPVVVAPSRMVKRIDTLIARAVVTLYDSEGKPLGEVMSDEMKIFRASVPDVWGALDRATKVEER